MKRETVRRTFTQTLWCAVAVLMFGSLPAVAADMNYEDARWHPLHFKPDSLTATNEQCLACHPEILSGQVKSQAQVGIKSDNALAWYQTMDTYQGEQDTFHRRHLLSDYAREVMDLKCNTCHEGYNPREATPIPPTSDGSAGYTMRKLVNPETTCLKCHAQMNYTIMGLPAPWPEIRETMNNDCLSCHVTFRTNRHQVTYLKPDAIEKAAKERGGDVCYGCHGGRAWYRINYPYPRHPWPNMAKDVPDWAKDRPAQSEERFRLDKTGK
jgi:hypothetical protein